MLKFLRKSFRNTVYVRIQPEWLSVLQVASGKKYADVPVVAIEKIKGKRVIAAIGREALAKKNIVNFIICNGFNHPRTPIADFTVAEKTLQYFLKQLFSNKLFTPSPIIIMHPLGTFQGEITQVEIRAFAELGMISGARKVYVWEGPELSREELLGLNFSRTNGRLLYNPDMTPKKLTELLREM